MNKISIVNLEKIRGNPSSYGKALKDGTLSSNSFRGRPKSIKWHDAIIEYHKANDLSKAISRLERSFSNRKDTPKNRREVEDLIIALGNYVDEYNLRNYTYLDKSIYIKNELSPQLTLSGMIWLLYMKPNGGYAGYIISKEVDELHWFLELRFPIIQEYIANMLYGCKIEVVDVGVIDYQLGKSYVTTYSPDDVHNSVEELHEIVVTISDILTSTN